MPKYKIDEINVLENYIGMVEQAVWNAGEKIEEKELLEIEDNIEKLRGWIKEIKSKETFKDLKWKIKTMDKILENEKNVELINAVDDGLEEGMKIQKEYIEGIEEWLNDLKNECEKVN